MANIKFEPQITITFSHREFRLVGLALAGLVSREEDSAACLELNGKLVSSLAAESASYDKRIQGAKKAADAGVLVDL